MKNDTKKNVALVLPCYNVGWICGDIAKESQKYVQTVVAVDDGSTDNTLAVLQESDVTIVRHVCNQGKGAALRTAIQFLLPQADWDILIFMDADGQHPVELIPQLVEPLEKGEADLVIGSRDFDRKKMPWKRWIANTFSSKLISKLFGSNLRDIQSGFRAYSRSLIETLSPQLHATGYEIETEMLLLSLKAKKQIVEKNIPLVYSEESSQSSKWRAFQDSWRIAKTVVSIWRRK